MRLRIKFSPFMIATDWVFCAVEFAMLWRMIAFSSLAEQIKSTTSMENDQTWFAFLSRVVALCLTYGSSLSIDERGTIAFCRLYVASVTLSIFRICMWAFEFFTLQLPCLTWMRRVPLTTLNRYWLSRLGRQIRKRANRYRAFLGWGTFLLSLVDSWHLEKPEHRALWWFCTYLLSIDLAITLFCSLFTLIVQLLVSLGMRYFRVWTYHLLVRFLHWVNTPPASEVEAENEATKDEISKVAPLQRHAGNSQEQNCAVCHEDFDVGQFVRWLPCRHHFHANCIDAWLAIKQDCPICRRNLFETSPSNRQRPVRIF